MAKKKQIVVVQSGWVFIGQVTKNGTDDVIIESAKNIRNWGTTKGLGQIASEGLLKDTATDSYGTIRVPFNQILFFIDCEV